MTKKKQANYYNWLPKKAQVVKDPLFHYLTVLDKWSKTIPKKLPVSLTLKFGTDVPSHHYDTRRFIP